MSTDTNTGDDQNGTETAAHSGQDAPNGPGQGEGTPDGSPGVSAPADDQEGAGNTEAAGYRRRLRDTERERDALAERVDRYRRTEVSRLAADTLAVGTDLLSIGDTALADLVNDDGDPDPQKIRTAAETLVRTRPGLKRGPTPGETRAAIGQGGTHSAPTAPGTTWTDVLSRGR